MIFYRALVDSPWKRVVPGFFLFNSFTLLSFFIVFDILGYEKNFFIFVFFIICLLSAVLFLIGHIFDGPCRLKFFVLIVGAFGVVPIFYPIWRHLFYA